MGRTGHGTLIGPAGDAAGPARGSGSDDGHHEGDLQPRGGAGDLEGAAGALGRPTRHIDAQSGATRAAGPASEGPLRQGEFELAIEIDGVEVHFRRANIERLPDGDWDFTLTC